MTDSRRSVARFLALTLFTALAYLALGWQAKTTFAWEAVATTLWLPAGLANAVVVVHGSASLPGVALGNLLARACGPGPTCRMEPGQLMVALAAAAQAMLVRWQLNRQKLLTGRLDRWPQLLEMLLWIGPLGCWPAALAYVLMVSAASGVSEGLLTRGLFWWVGDSLGSLLLFPLLLLFLPRSRPFWREYRPRLLQPLLMLIGLIGLVTFLGKSITAMIGLQPELVEPLQLLRLLLSVSQLAMAFGGVALLLHTAGLAHEQLRRQFRSRLAADAAGAVLHEIGQPLLRLELLISRLQERLSAAGHGLSRDAAAAQLEIERIGTTSRAIQDLTLAGIRDTPWALLQQAIDTSASQLRHEFERLDQQFTVECSVSPAVEAGQIQLQAALRNLLRNASQAAGDHGVIRLAVKLCGRQVLLRLEDSGPGFPLAALAADGRCFSAWGGLGLGLQIVRRVVDEAGGRLDLGRSPVLGGALVELRLPLAPVSARHPELESSTEPPSIGLA